MIPARSLILLGLIAVAPLPARLACASVPNAKPHGVHKKDEKLQIVSLEDQWKQATLTGDAIAMDKLLSSDYVGISMSGQIATKQQQLDRLRTRATHITAMELTDTRIKLVKSIAIVTGLAEVDGTNEGQDVKGQYRYTRIYQLQPTGIWQITNFEVTRIPRNRPPDRANRDSPPPMPPK